MLKNKEKNNLFFTFLYWVSGNLILRATPPPPPLCFCLFYARFLNKNLHKVIGLLKRPHFQPFSNVKSFFFLCVERLT